MAQTFWVLDADTHQPVCFTTATAARSVVEATPELMDLTESILSPTARETLIFADAEHFSGELIDDIQRRTGFDFLVRIPNRPAHRKRYRQIPAGQISAEQFTPRWAGFAVAKLPYRLYRRGKTYYQFATAERRTSGRLALSRLLVHHRP